MIKRDYYLNQVIDRMWNGNIKVITGIRHGYQVDVGVVKDRRNGAHKINEIDFVVNYFDKRIYIQSAITVMELGLLTQNKKCLLFVK